VITAVNGEAVKDARELARVIGGLAPGSAAKLDVLHNGKNKVVNVTLGQLPNAQQAKADTEAGRNGSADSMDVPRLGMTVAPADKVEGAGKTGVVVTKVDPKSAASDRGFKKGDVILEVAGKSVANPGDVRDAIEAARADKKSSVLMRLRSGDASHYVAVPLANG
jgi:serine protease Do